MQTVCIVGVGLIGGSFAQAIRKHGFAGEIIGVSSPRTIEEALNLGVIDRSAPLQEAAAAADLIYLAQPISGILETIAALDGVVREGALVTDAGSTKSLILQTAARKLPAVAYLGGHPMAGKEQRGVGASDAELFRNRNYFLAVNDPAVLDHPVAEELVDYIEKMGSRPILIGGEEHDKLVAFTSHLPQLASTALASSLAKLVDGPLARKGAGPGLIDMTRLAMSSFDLWTDILGTNAPAIDRALSLYIKELQEMRSALRGSTTQEAFNRAAEFAAFLRRPPAEEPLDKNL